MISANRRLLIRWSMSLVVAFFLLSASYFLIARDQILYQTVNQGFAQTASQTPAGEITAGKAFIQPFSFRGDRLYSVSLLAATYSRENVGQLTIAIFDQTSQRVLFEQQIDVKTILDNAFLQVTLPSPIISDNQMRLALRLTSNSIMDKSITVWQRPSSSETSFLSVNGEQRETELVYTLTGNRDSSIGHYYLLAVLSAGFFLVLYCIYAIIGEQKGKITLFLRAIEILNKYGFLIQQLVARDFKSKYKRSVLGVLWSFLNPILVMAVQFIVFSTLFKSNIKNFPVYLLTGIVFFSFFIEASSMSLLSIVGNASLITKVYMPKYIYPISRVMSSTINLLLSLVPLFLVVLFTGTRFTMAFLLLPYGVFCLVIFSIGIGMALSASMVYFRDTQFLWNVISMLWMYATPIFYPENIIPERFSFIIRYNPLYHFIKFSRTIILTGLSPEILEFIYVGLFALGMFLFGAFVFKRTQDKFILYI